MLNKLNKKINNEYLSLDVKDMDKIRTTYIFAKNGAGKTTYTNEIEKDKNIFIFNSDYVANNIYIDKLQDEEKTSSFGPTQTSNSYSMLFGEGIAKHIEAEKEVNTKIKENLIILKDLTKNNWSFTYSQSNSIEEINVKKIKATADFGLLEVDVIKKEINDRDNKLSNLSLVNFHKNQLNSLNIHINLLEVSKKELNSIITKSISEEELIINVYEAAEKVKKTFLFLGTEIKQNDIISKLSKIKTEKSKKVRAYNKRLKKVKDEIKLIKETEIKNLKIPELTTWLETLSEYGFEKINPFDELDKNSIDLIFERMEVLKLESKDSLVRDINTFINKNIYKLLKNDIEPFVIKMYFLNKELLNVRKIKNKFMKVLEGDMQTRMNYFIGHFDLGDFQISLNSKNLAGIDGTCKIESDTKNINKLSEGEKKILSLSYFLANFENKIQSLDEDIVLILDDPFDSNDHTKSNKLKNLEFNFNGNDNIKSLGGLQKEYMDKTGKFFKIIVLTHNINVLYVLTQNIMESNKYSGKSFNKMKKRFKGTIEIQEWIKSGNVTDVYTKNIRSFYPNEDSIMESISKMTLNYIKNDWDINEIRIVWLVLMRLNDLKNNENKKNQNFRIFYKVLCQNNSWGKDELGNKINASGPDKIIESIKCLLKDDDIDDIDIERRLETINKMNEDCELYTVPNDLAFDNIGLDIEEIEIMKKFFVRFVKVVNNASSHKDEDFLRRLRHRNYLSSTIVAFGIEES